MAHDTDLRLHPTEETRETESLTPTSKSRWRFSCGHLDDAGSICWPVWG
ncbi:MAG: hypothetical protein ACFB0E_04280 [Leptolyngbyaceae cyanobacterium]